MARCSQPAVAATVALGTLAAALLPAVAAHAAGVEENPLTITVTARRIEENQQTVPVSVVSVPGSTLRDQGVSSTRDLQETVAGLFATAPNPRLSAFTLRGLGSSAFNEGLESSVALFMDGVYLGRPGMSITDLIDVERVEVARGPQGTLFGKNSTAGTLSIFTRKPLFTPEAEVDASLGSQGTQQYRGSLTGPLGRTLAGRLTAYQTSRDGLVTNRYDGSKVNDIFRQGLRGQLLWTPASTVSARLIAEVGAVDESCCAFPLMGAPRPGVQASDAYMKYQRVSPDPTQRQTDTDIRPRSQVNQRAVSLQTDWDFTPNDRLVSLSAFRHYDFQSTTDDQTSMALVNGGTQTVHDQFSQELRIDSRWRKADTILGLFLLDQTTRGQEVGLLGRELSDWVFGGLIRQRIPTANRDNTGTALHLLIPQSTLDGMQVVTPFRQHTTSLAGFGSLNWHATDQLDLTAGLRYTYEWKDAQVDRYRTGGNPSASPLALTNNLTPLGTLTGINLSGATFNQFLDDTVGGPYHRDTRLQEGSLSGQLGASWRWTPELMTYLTASHGVKSGGVNLGVTSDRVPAVFRPEVADSLELGLKTLALDDHLLLNLAAYYATIRDYQALTFDESQTLIPNPRLNNLLNVSQVTLKGVDLDLQVLLPKGFSLRGGVALNQAVTDDFRNAPDENTQKNTKDLSGKPLANAPRWQGNFAVRRDWAVNSHLSGYAMVDYWFRTSYNATTERSIETEIDEYGVLGARLGFKSSNDAWDLSLWGRNLANTRYISGVLVLYGVGSYGGIAGDPRMVGTTLRLKWR